MYRSLLITYCIWLASEILLNRLLRSKSSDRQNEDRGSLSLIWITIVTSITLAVFVSMKVNMPIFSDSAYWYTGLVVIWIGIALRLLAVATLGKFFTADVTIREGHRLKKNGLYRYLRHPSYFASLLSFIGFGLTLNNVFSLLIILISMLAVFIYRIRVEEKLLTSQFGSEYLTYKQKTKALIPFIY